MSRRTSNWKRPKPKMYECNFRDHERFYQDNYKDYSTTKDFLTQNASTWAEREADLRKEFDNIHKYGTRRAESMTPRKFYTPESPLSMQRASSNIALQDVNAESSYVKSRLEASREKNYLTERKASLSRDDTASSSISMTRASSLPKSKSVYDTAQDEEMANIEQRLLKLRKLREELGLPSEVGSDPAPEPISAKGREIKSSYSSSSAASSSTSRSRGLDSTDDYSSTRNTARSSSITNGISNARSSSISRDESSRRSALSRDEPEEYKPTRRSARAAAAASAGTSSSRSSVTREERESKYSAEPSPRLRSRKAIDDNFDSIKVKSSSKSSSTKGSSSKIINDVDNYDDDMLLPDLRKKLPSSQEILDRIKDMDL